MTLDLARIQVKILSNAAVDISLDPFLEIFNRWRKEKHPLEWVDLADYAHVPKGPGIVLIGNRGNLSFDLGDPAPWILYAAKKGLTGTHRERLQSAFLTGMDLSSRLSMENNFPREVRLQTSALELRFNDRLATANSEATDIEIRPAIVDTLNALMGTGNYRMKSMPDPRSSYGWSVRANHESSLESLIQRLGTLSAK